jgi:hypothetical protein
MTLDLKELKRLADAAPLIVITDNGNIVRVTNPAFPKSGVFLGRVDHEMDMTPSLAQFIAASRTAVPALIAEVERLRGLLSGKTMYCIECENRNRQALADREETR